QYTHQENQGFNDYKREPLLPHVHSTQGPRVARGDVNGDGRVDLYVGGAKGQAGQLFVQGADGRFSSTAAGPWRADAGSEDVSSLFFDADGDGDVDLYVASGGSEWGPDDEALQDRLYLNDGAGTFVRTPLPTMITATGAVAAADWDGDGDQDLFVGGRLVPGSYGVAPRSYLLRNEGTAPGGTPRFEDVTAELVSALHSPGLVTSAVWTDLDADQRPDLLLTGEWMPLRVFMNRAGSWEERTDASGLSDTGGWWNTLAAADFDGDGDTDFIAGNRGLNHQIQATPQEPTCIYLKDFDGSGTVDPIICSYVEGKLHPFASRDELLDQVGSLKKKFRRYDHYADATIEDVFGASELDDARVLTASTFHTSYVENKGDGTFEVHPLPAAAQFAPVYAVLPGDFDGDGRTDVVLGGNLYRMRPRVGRSDASFGLMLRGDGKGGFTVTPPGVSGLVLDGEVRDLAQLSLADGSSALLVAINDAPVRLYDATALRSRVQ
ncbi:MAG: VCBS repeat-containing protein, partial [Catalinimonas sp.]